MSLSSVERICIGSKMNYFAFFACLVVLLTSTISTVAHTDPFEYCDLQESSIFREAQVKNGVDAYCALQSAFKKDNRGRAAFETVLGVGALVKSRSGFTTKSKELSKLSRPFLLAAGVWLIWDSFSNWDSANPTRTAYDALDQVIEMFVTKTGDSTLGPYYVSSERALAEFFSLPQQQAVATINNSPVLEKYLYLTWQKYIELKAERSSEE